MSFPGGSVVKNPPASIGDLGSIPGLGRFLGEGNGKATPLLLPGKSHGQRTWQATVHGVAKESDTTN